MKAGDFFAHDYTGAREKFLEACAAAGIEYESHRNPASGPAGEALYTDVAVLGPEESGTVLLLGSATHGVEGFCGSGIETGLLYDGLESRLPPDLRVVMIHAINPYGFAHLRRTNEDNVDLNRNFVDHTQPHPPNPDYEALAGAIAPRDYWMLASGAALLRLQLYRLRHGWMGLQAAISRGQYTHAEGLFYGGRFETWSNRTLRGIVADHLEGAERLAYIDFHTGLGPYGYGELITHEVPGAPAHRRAVDWWGERTKNALAGEAVSAPLSGTIKMALIGMLPDAEWTTSTLEFGTYPRIRMLRVLQAENWAHHYGQQTPDRFRSIKAEMKAAFYPDHDDWKQRVWEQGRDVVDQALRGLMSGGWPESEGSESID